MTTFRATCIGVPAILIGMTGAVSAQSILHLPLDADNCAIHRALSPETAHACDQQGLGAQRGIVLRINDAVKAQPTPQGVTQSDLRKALGTTQAIRSQTPTVRVASNRTSAGATPRNHAAADPQNGYFVQFAFNSIEIEPKFRDHLDRLSEVLKVSAMASTCVKIIGHTDTVGASDYNKKLSEKRALSVAAYLVDQHGIAPVRLALEAAGEERPLPDVPGDDALNRRVEFATKDAQGGC